MFCHKCGKQIGDNDTFCPYCGVRITARPDTGETGTIQKDPARSAFAGKTPEKSAPAKGKTGGGCCGVIMILIAVVIVAGVVNAVREKRDGAEQGKGSQKAAEVSSDPREYLKDYIDNDTRIIFAEYEGIEDDIQPYLAAHSELEGTQEDKEYYARIRLKNEYVEAAMQEALQNREKKVCVIGMHTDSENRYLNTGFIGYDNGVFRSFPYSTFWLKSSEGISGFLPNPDPDKYFGESWHVYSFDYYPIGDSEIHEMKTRIDREVEDILSCIPQDADLWLKCKTIHDELVKRISYDDHFEEHCHDLYGALVKHKTVCEGYALAFRYILNQTGETCDIVISDWDEQPTSGTHAWNCIYAQTEERYIDVTWDDYDWTDSDGNSVVFYDYFGLTGEEISAIDSHGFDSSTIRLLYSDEPEAFNYYRHENCLLSSFDEWELTELFAEQYYGGKELLTVRFDNQEAYQAACGVYANNDRIGSLMGELGYYGYWWWVNNDVTRTLSIGFGELQKNE